MKALAWSSAFMASVKGVMTGGPQNAVHPGGVVYYISPEAVDGALVFIAGHSGSGSFVIFDYTEKAVVEGAYRRSEISSMRRYKAVSGEEVIFGIDKNEIQGFLESRGFHDVVNVTGDDLHRMYFTGANEKRKVAPVYSIVHAMVKGNR